MYVSTFYGNSIRRISTEGVVTTIAGSVVGSTGSSNGFGTSSSFNCPFGIAINSAGKIYVADWLNGKVRSVDTRGK
jgi:DNA-binding beta-propeller fold protein YncE